MAQSRLEQLYSYLQEDPNDPFLYYAIATEKLRSDPPDPEGAIEQFEILVDRFPTYIGTYYHFGKLLQQRGNKERAIDLYREGIKHAEDARERNTVRELKEALNKAIGFDDGWD